MSDAMSHAAAAGQRHLTAAEERYGSLSDEELEAEGERVQDELVEAEHALHAAQEQVRTLTALAEQVTSVWLERSRGR